MYWHVVEVKAEPDYSLFVRFADGSGGRMRLAPEDFTGVLAPLREASFFGTSICGSRCCGMAQRDRSGARCGVSADRWGEDGHLIAETKLSVF